jgi:hypothetical protein
VTTSAEFSTNLKILIYKSSELNDGKGETLQGECNDIADPLLDAETDCKNLVGDLISIRRTCPVGVNSCQLGLCGTGVLSNCDCSTTQIGKSFVDITRGYA